MNVTHKQRGQVVKKEIKLAAVLKELVKGNDNRLAGNPESGIALTVSEN